MSRKQQRQHQRNSRFRLQARHPSRQKPRGSTSVPPPSARPSVMQPLLQRQTSLLGRQLGHLLLHQWMPAGSAAAALLRSPSRRQALPGCHKGKRPLPSGGRAAASPARTPCRALRCAGPGAVRQRQPRWHGGCRGWRTRGCPSTTLQSSLSSLRGRLSRRRRCDPRATPNTWRPQKCYIWRRRRHHVL